MATYFLRPSADVGSLGNVPTKVGGSGSYASTVNDSSDSSWTQFIGTGCGYVWTLSSLSLSAGEYVMQYRIVVRYDTGAGTTDLYCYIPGGAADYYTDSISLTSRTGAWKTVDPATGGTLTASSFPQITIWDRGAGTTSPRVVDVYVEVQTNFSPVPTATGPNTTVNNNSQPTFTWTYADTEGNPQSKYRVKVYNSIQVAAAGFDPNTSTAFVDSGEVYSSATSWQVPTPLPNGTYRAYIFVADSGSGQYNSVNVFGPYAYVYIFLTAPAVPTITSLVTDPVNLVGALQLLDRQNWLSTEDASFEGGTTGNWVFSSNATLTNKATNGLDGSRCLKAVANANGNMLVQMNHTQYGTGNPGGLAGMVMCAEMAVYAVTTARTVLMQMVWYGSDGTTVIGTTSGNTYQERVGAYVRVAMTATAPTNAYYCVPQLLINSAVTSEEHNIDCCLLRPTTYVNLAKSPIFENDVNGDGIDDYWAKYTFGGTDTSVLSVETAANRVYAGQYSQKMYTGAAVGSGNWRGITQAVDVPLNQFVTVSVWVMVDTPNTDINIYFPAGSGSNTSTVTVVNAFTWTRINCTVQCNSAYNSNVYIRCGTAGINFWVGNVTITDSYLASDAINNSWTRGGLLSVARLQVQRSADGVTWSTLTHVYDQYGVTSDLSYLDFLDLTETLLVWDYELPPVGPAYYRIRTYATPPSSATIYSAWSPAIQTTYTYTPSDRWALKAPYNPSLNALFQMKAQGNSWKRTSAEQAAFFNPIGRTRSVKVTDTIQGDTFELTAMLTSQAQANQWNALRAYQGTLLIVSPDNRSWYAAFQNQVTKEDVLVANPFYREYTATFEEQDAPA